jgi:hypothetical protein
MGIFFALFQNLCYVDRQKNLTDSKLYIGTDNLSIDEAIEEQKQKKLFFELGRYNFWTDE